MSRIPLASVADRSQLERIRPYVEGRSCVLVGSAPLTAPLVVAPDDVVVPINGAISSAPRADLWFLGSKSYDNPSQQAFMHPLHRQMLAQAAHRRAGHVVLLRGPKVASEAYTLQIVRGLSCVIESWSVFDKPTKRWIEGELCGRQADAEPCSSGLLAVACTLWCGAASVRLDGFALTPGYHYLRQQTPQRWWRDHVQADARALAALQARYGSRLSGAILQTVAA